jgi:hypothetical protein
MQKLLDEHDKASMEACIAPTGAGMLTTGDQLLPSHRSANSSTPSAPTASQALLDVHETASSAPCWAPVGKLGKGSTDQRTPFQRSATGISTCSSFMDAGT